MRAIFRIMRMRCICISRMRGPLEMPLPYQGKSNTLHDRGELLGLAGARRASRTRPNQLKTLVIADGRPTKAPARVAAIGQRSRGRRSSAEWGIEGAMAPA